MEKPTDRPEGLDAVSEEHYAILLFGWKMAEGLRKGIETQRLKAYADWFMKTYLEPHFEMEERFVFPILGLSKVRVKRALANHRRLIRLFTDEEEVYKSLNRIEEEIGSFIRFEERVILRQIQERATPEQLKRIKKEHDKLRIGEGSWKDKFWKEEVE